MTFDFYVCNDDPRKLIKSTFNREEIAGVLKDHTDILRPVIQVTPFENYAIYNYLYIPQFNRYYFLKQPTIELGGLLNYTGEVDPLYSWYQSIQQLSGITDRSANNNVFLADSHMKQQQNLNIIQHNFEGSELLPNVSQSNASIVLNVLGV